MDAGVPDRSEGAWHFLRRAMLDVTGFSPILSVGMIAAGVYDWHSLSRLIKTDSGKEGIAMINMLAAMPGDQRSSFPSTGVTCP